MKKFIILVFLAAPFFNVLIVSGQTATAIEYLYDDNGNRYHRHVLSLKTNTNTEDSIPDQNDSLVVSEYLGESLIKIYPNPTSDKIYIEFISVNYSSKTYASLFNIDGSLIRQYFLPETINQVDVSKESTGIYILKLFSEGVEKSFKIIKE